MTDETDDEARRERGRAMMREANRRLLQRVGVAHEAMPGIAISLELAAKLQQHSTGGR